MGNKSVILIKTAFMFSVGFILFMLFVYHEPEDFNISLAVLDLSVLAFALFVCPRYDQTTRLQLIAICGILGIISSVIANLYATVLSGVTKDLSFVALACLSLNLPGGLSWRESWKQSRYWTILPFFLSLIFIGSTWTTAAIADSIDRAELLRHQDDFTKIVEEIHHRTTVSSHFQNIDINEFRALPPHIVCIGTSRLKNGAIMVEFGKKDGRGYRGYVYSDCKLSDMNGRMLEFEQRHHLKHLVGNWYHFTF